MKNSINKKILFRIKMQCKFLKNKFNQCNIVCNKNGCKWKTLPKEYCVWHILGLNIFCYFWKIKKIHRRKQSVIDVKMSVNSKEPVKKSV